MPSKGKNTKDPRVKHLRDSLSNAASTNDFTGLIPANPEQPEKPYRDIHAFGTEPVKKVRE